jgi:IS5 family transposase
VVEVAKDHGIKLKQTFAKKGKLLGYKAACYAHARHFKHIFRVIEHQFTIVDRLHREITRKLIPLCQAVQEDLDHSITIAKGLIARTQCKKAQGNHSKLFSWYAQEVQ